VADLSVGVQSAARGAVCCVSQVRLELLGSAWNVLAEDRV